MGTPTPETPDAAIPSSVKPFHGPLMTEELRAFVLEEKGLVARKVYKCSCQNIFFVIQMVTASY